MKILIDIGHPAHVHLFKHFTWKMLERNHKILFTTRDKEVAIHLLTHYKFDFVSFGKPFKSKIGKVWGLIYFTFKLLAVALKFKPDIFLHSTMYSSIASWMLRKPHISFEDTGNLEQIFLYKPFTNAILTPSCFHKNLGKKQINYDGLHELAYLHPNYFRPDNQIYSYLGISPEEKYIIIRFVSWNASHDFGQSGFTINEKFDLIRGLSEKYKVFISSEEKLPDQLQPYQYSFPPELMHDVLAKASLYIGEGATTASECVMLGVPAIYINTIEAGTINEQEKYGLLFHFSSFDGVLRKAFEILQEEPNSKLFQKHCEKLLHDKIDVTAFMVWFIENWPESFQVMKKNPDYQYQFK